VERPGETLRRRPVYQSRRGYRDRDGQKLKVEDAKNATRAGIEEGMVAGGGVALLRASQIPREIQGEATMKSRVAESSARSSSPGPADRRELGTRRFHRGAKILSSSNAWALTP